jgi:Ser/Thr protein kinase RdoA (MazF antagonist)
MHLLDYTPAFDAESAVAIAEEHFGVRGSARQLPSERDQNFLLTDSAEEKFVLKIANSLESPAFLDAQNFVLKHLATRVSFCQRLVTSVSGEEIVTIEGGEGRSHSIRMVSYLPGVPMAEIKPHPPALLHDLGRTLGQLAHVLKDFDHPAVHREFHWDLANGNRVVSEFGGLIKDPSLRELVLRCRFDLETPLRRSVIHGDANDYNVLVDPQTLTVAGLIDFGDMIYSYTVADLVIAIAYVVLDKSDPLAAARSVIEGYVQQFLLLDEEFEALWRLVLLRLAMSASMAAYQQQQRPENEYLQISQRAIAENLPRLLAITDLRG